jgi:hypothetical protein
MLVDFAIRMPGWVQLFADGSKKGDAGSCASLAVFVEHDAPLRRERPVVDAREQVPHPVALEPERPLQLMGCNDLVVRREVARRDAVDVARPHRLERLDEVPCAVRAALEHQVLDQVRESGVARRLIAVTDVIPHEHGDLRASRLRFEHHVEPVGEAKPLRRDRGRRSALRERSAPVEREGHARRARLHPPTNPLHL